MGVLAQAPGCAEGCGDGGVVGRTPGWVFHNGCEEKLLEFVQPLLGHFYGKFMEKMCLKAPEYYSAPILIYAFSACLWGRPKTFISMISGFVIASFFPKIN